MKDELKKYLGKEFADRLRTILEELKEIKEVKAVYLFGSYARGKQLPFSDIDICVICDKLNEKEKPRISALSSEKIQISIFDELPVYIRFRVLKGGRQLFCRDEKFLHNITFSVLKEYFNFQPLLRRFERFYLHGI